MTILNFIFINSYIVLIVLGVVYNICLYFENSFLEEDILTTEETFKIRVEYSSLQYED